MLLNKYSLDIPARFVGENDARYILNGVYLTLQFRYLLCLRRVFPLCYTGNHDTSIR
jgi:hypothetical protein